MCDHKNWEVVRHMVGRCSDCKYIGRVCPNCQADLYSDNPKIYNVTCVNCGQAFYIDDYGRMLDPRHGHYDPQLR
jgi:hypothetical protein